MDQDSRRGTPGDGGADVGAGDRAADPGAGRARLGREADRARAGRRAQHACGGICAAARAAETQTRPDARTARRRAAADRRRAARRRGRGQCGRRAAAARASEAIEVRAADAAAGGRAAPPSKARRRARDGSVRDGAGASDADRLRREVVVDRRSRDAGCYFFVAVLGYSRRIFVRAFAAASARTIGARDSPARSALRRRHADGARRQRRRARRRARLARRRRARASGVRAFCSDWGVEAARCRPYRARTKGKTESGVGYVKRNAIAGRAFDELRRARGASRDAGWSTPISASTARRTSGRSIGSSARSGSAAAAARRGRCRCAAAPV